LGAKSQPMGKKKTESLRKLCSPNWGEDGQRGKFGKKKTESWKKEICEQHQTKHEVRAGGGVSKGSVALNGKGAKDKKVSRKRFASE